MHDLLQGLDKPVLILSTKVGRGMYYLGDALREAFEEPSEVRHQAIEDFLPQAGVKEDVERYKIISNRFPFLLHLIYKCPFFYYRKYLREKLFARSGLYPLEKTLIQEKIKTVICISHRAAFWASNHKRLTKGGFELWDLLGEYGNNYGYKYIFWDQMNGFLSPVPQSRLKFKIPQGVRFKKILLPARKEYYRLAKEKGDKNKVLLICGYWGQGPILKIMKQLLEKKPDLKIRVVCGENQKILDHVKRFAAHMANIKTFPVVDSLVPLIKECASVITKPGISTLLEAHAANRKIFLLKGMPVAEDNNARHAIKYFNAQWYGIDAFFKWLGFDG